MADIVTPAKRSLMMAGIKGKNTKPELLIRRALHAKGFRFRIHNKSLPGKPDLVFPKHKAIILVNGCFWHGHDCTLFKWPSSRIDFWKSKIENNRKCDAATIKKLHDLGWRVGTVWECALRGKKRKKIETVVLECSEWLVSDIRTFEIRSEI